MSLRRRCREMAARPRTETRERTWGETQKVHLKPGEGKVEVWC